MGYFNNFLFFFFQTYIIVYTFGSRKDFFSFFFLIKDVVSISIKLLFSFQPLLNYLLDFVALRFLGR